MMELELTLRTSTGKTDTYKFTIYAYNFRLPVNAENSSIFLDTTLYEQLPQPILRLAIGQYQSADAAIIISGNQQRSLVFREIKLMNQLYENGNYYPGSEQASCSLSFDAKSCIVDGVEFIAQASEN